MDYSNETNGPESGLGFRSQVLNPSSGEINQITNLIRKDSRLPPYIKPRDYQLQVKTCEIEKVLLTGGTGTLGPYVLRELVNLPQVTKVVCLIRGAKGKKDTDHLENRLLQVLQEKRIVNDINWDKVEVVYGDVAERYFDCDASTWQAIINSTDAIFHCAAKISYLEKYKDDVVFKGDVRSVNLAATKNVLEFVCSGQKLKQLFYASSVVAVGAVDGDDSIFSEDWQNLEDFDGSKSTFAYPISKFVGEMLVKEAVERGITAKVLRLPLIGGHSEDGSMGEEGNLIFALYLFALKNGIMLDDSFFGPYLPVDKCAEAGTKICFVENAPGGIYNIFTGSIDENGFKRVAANLGYKLTRFDNTWEVLNQLSSTSKTSKALSSMIASLIENEFLGNNIVPQAKIFHALRFLNTKINSNFFISKKLQTYLPEYYKSLGSVTDYFEKDVLYAKSKGWIENV